MSDLKEQQLYTRALEKSLPWYRWFALGSAIIWVASIIWSDTIVGDFKFGSGIIFVFMVAAYINTVRRLHRLRAANARSEYILGKEFSVATYDEDGNEIEENDHTNK